MMSNDWTNKLRDRLTDYQEPVTDDLWAAIQQSLAQQNAENTPISNPTVPTAASQQARKTAKTVALRRFSVAAALAALAVGGTYVYLHPSEKDEVLAQATAVQAKDHLSQGKQAEDRSSDETEMKSLSSERTSTRESDSEAFAKYAESVKEKLGIQHLQADSCSQKTDNQIVSARQATKHDNVIVRSKKSLESDQDLLAIASSPYEVPTSQASHRQHRGKASSWSMQLYGENGVVGSKNSSGFDFNSIPSSDAGSPVFPGDFGDSFYSANLMAVRALAGAPSADYYEKVKHHFPVSVGLQVGFGITNRLRVSTGVVYTYVSSDFINSAYNTTQNTTQTLHYVGVPVHVSYDFWQSKRFKTYVTAGGEGDINVKNQTESDGQSLETKRDRMQWSANAALGAQYDIIPQLGLYFEPGAKYYFDNGSQIENTFKDKKLNFNLQFGLRWNIK